MKKSLLPFLLMGMLAAAVPFSAVGCLSISQPIPPPESWVLAQNSWNPGVDSPVPSAQPSPSQAKQIARKYGMFVHFGLNTFLNLQWSDGTKPASAYNPPVIDAKQWVETAKKAGMSYLILITKHHDGFCMWDSPYTDYDVAASPNPTDVIRAVADECKKQGIELGFYYSLWDRHVNPDTRNPESDAAYNEYMFKQLTELMTRYGDICELWLDGGWTKESWRWPTREIYQLVKKLQPNCQIAVNWTIGAPGNPDQHAVFPETFQEGYPIRYFPSDFRLGDPFLPAPNDPKRYSHHGELFYMPWESTLCLSTSLFWFYDTRDRGPRSVNELYSIYRQATANDNILIINIGPNREGRLPDRDVRRILELKAKIDAEAQ